MCFKVKLNLETCLQIIKKREKIINLRLPCLALRIKVAVIHKVYTSCFTLITVTVSLSFNWTVQSFGKIDIKILVCCKSYFIHVIAKEHFFGCLLKIPSFSWLEGLLQRVTGWLSLEGTCGTHPVQIPCSGRANQSFLPRAMVRWFSDLVYTLTRFSLNLDNFLRSIWVTRTHF